MAGRIGRPIFRRHATYVAVRPIKLNGIETLQPGEVVSGRLRPHHLKSLYQRRRIGPEGHAWTEAMLATKGFHKPEVGKHKEPEPKNEKTEAELPEPVKTGHKWHAPGDPETLPTFRTKKEAAAWIEANWADLQKEEEESEDGEEEDLDDETSDETSDEDTETDAEGEEEPSGDPSDEAEEPEEGAASEDDDWLDGDETEEAEDGKAG